jgi:mannose-6-phosphate isomerase-like protein (cupin superfamily)
MSQRTVIVKSELVMRSIRRVVASQSASGKAIFTHDGPAPNVKYRQATGIYSTLLWVTDETPADNARQGDGADRECGTAPPPSGTIFRIVDFPPPSKVPETVSNEAVLKEMGITEGPPESAAARSPFMHRTKSIDYAIVLEGEIDMLLDDSEVHLSAGEILIQRGTSHAWVNRGTHWCRVAFVLVDAKP